jgi:7-carboxy-7-deazaguanine synthase
MIDICEIFLSIQGESTYQGLPCIFIRFSGCNLRCSYCDTTYSFQSGKLFTVDEIIQYLKKEYGSIKLVEITGGEPLLQREIISLIERLQSERYKVLIETNGSLNLQDIPDYVVKVVDVKCPGSGEVDSFRIDNLSYLNDKDELKFVLADHKDYLFAKEFITKHQIKTPIIHFSPVIVSLSPATLAEWILKDRLNVRLHLQLHKYIWNPDTRGV